MISRDCGHIQAMDANNKADVDRVEMSYHPLTGRS
jgi:hypothetical protein